MDKIIFFAFLIFSYNMNAQKKSIVIKLDSLKKTGHKIEVLKFNYGNISCPCAQWAESKFNSEKGINK